MKLVIDIVLLVIIALCTWKGYKKGLIGNIISLFIIMVALLGGTILSKAYSGEVIPVLRPFIGGYVDSQYPGQDNRKHGLQDRRLFS